MFNFKLLKTGISTFVFLLIALFILSAPTVSAQQNQYGEFYIPALPDWNLNSGRSSETQFVFQNSKTNEWVALNKTAANSESKQEFNKQILGIIQSLYKQGRFMEQRKQAAPYPCLGQKYCHMLVFKSRASGERTFILNPLVDNKMYTIEISGQAGGNVPSGSALNFISNISLEPGAEVIAQTAPPPKSNQTVAPQQNNQQNNDNLTAFKKNKTTAPPQTTEPQKTKQAKSTAKQNTTPVQAAKPKTTNQKTEVKATTINLPSQMPALAKGNIPEVKFSVTDPCAPTGADESSLPWGKKEAAKIKIPKDVSPAIPPVIPDLKSLSNVSYNSAVSAAFEGMRLVYGPMPDDEAKKFEAAWTPLFDYPTQEIIDYLNKLNPAVSQFLACRESYMRTLGDIQMVLLDAALAVEDDNQQAWEAAMAEAGMYADVIPPLDAAMKSLAQQIENLGNPPNPNAAKCEARRKYERFFDTPTEIEGCWAGVTETTALTKFRPLFQYNFKVKVNGTIRNYSIGLVHDIVNKPDYIFGGMCDDNLVDDKIIGQGWFLQKFKYPEIPEFSEISDSKFRGLIKEWNHQKLSNVECPSYLGWDIEIEHAQEYIEIKSFAPIFFETALEWTREKKWEDFDYTADEDDSFGYFNWWECPKEVLFAFSDAFVNNLKGGSSSEKEKTVSKKTAVSTPNSNKNREAVQAEQDIKEAITFHTEMVGVIQHNLEREIAERNEVMKSLSASKNKKEADEHIRRLKDLDLRIIGLQSNMQAEQDLANSFKTGKIIHTRTVFDEYARNKFINDTRENAARVDATRRIAQRIDRQIELLPWEEQAKAREEARKILDGKTIASGDLEKAKRLVNAFNNKIQGYAEYDNAKAKEAEVDASQNEFYAQTTIMAAGALFVGMGSAALTQAYGAEAAATIYGPQILGSIWGGTTGLIAGGPKEGLVGAVSWASPKGFAAMQFLEGYEHAGYQKDASTADKIWGGVKQAGTAYIIGKVFELGIGMVTKGSLIAFGEESRLFKPVISSPSTRAKLTVDAMRTTQKFSEAKDALKSFQNLEVELAMLKRNPGANAQKISQLEAELQQLSASMNADYYAKWLFKYKASPGLRRQFDIRVQKNYAEMTPGMIRRLEAKGYNMEGIEFRQFRNASSGGSSSMDLDLGPVMKGTMNEPGIKMFKSKMVVKKDGSVATLEQFMNDSQAAMNAEYKQLTGMSAPSSDMNLVTSVHKEAFSTPKLLDKNVDFSNLTPEEIASVGKVLDVKMQGINKNQMMTNTTKLQAKCRESSKEIENMLLKKLRQDLQKAKAGSAQQKQIQADINYWEDMLKRFKQIGTDETNPMKIIEANREIMHQTGGRDVTGVINDLKQAFNR